jgi:deoxyribonuclease-1
LKRVVVLSLLFAGCDAPLSPSLGTAPSATNTPVVIASAPAASPPSVSPPPRGVSFSKAKRALRRLYDREPQRTLYADCPFFEWKLDWAKCCFVPEREVRKRIEWEHVVPAAAFGRGFVEWRDGHRECVDKRGKRYHGRKCARRTNATFRLAEGDMHNLVPVIGDLNERRGHKTVGLVDGEPRIYGSCDVEIETVFEPRPGARGDVARAYLYMAAAYATFALEGAQRAMLERWHRSDPPDPRERRRNDFIEAEQGNRNPWID